MSDEWRGARRLPDDPAYWDALAARALAAARRGSTADAHGSAAAAQWWRALARGAWPLAACAVLALLGSAYVLVGASARAAPAGALAGAFAPDDPMLSTVLNAGAEPSATVLLRLVALRAVE